MNHLIRPLFLPRIIGNYYPTSITIVGLEITEDAIYATKVVASGRKKNIVASIKEPVTQEETISFDDRAQSALQKIVPQLGSYDELCLCISNRYAVFKELTVPFTDVHKIKMVLPFEIEPLLPFSLQDAFVDAIVLGTTDDKKSSKILAAAVKRSVVAQFVQSATAAGLKPTRVSVHLFEFYAACKHIPEYSSSEQSLLIVEIYQNEAQFLAFSPQNTLILTRGITRGYANPKYLDDLQFTLDNANSVLGDKPIGRIVVASNSPETKQLCAKIQETTGIKTEEFLPYKLIHNNTVTAQKSLDLTVASLCSVGAALELPETRGVNFLQQDLAPDSSTVVLYQLITAGIFLLLILGSLLVHTQMVQYKLRKEISSSQEEAKKRLIQELTLTKQQAQGRSLEKLNAVARQQVDRQEAIWFALSSSNRYSFLNALQELSRRLNPQLLGLTLTSLSINDSTDTMTIEGEVRDYQALQLFEQELNRSTMFKEITRPQKPQFSIKVTLDKDYKED